MFEAVGALCPPLHGKIDLKMSRDEAQDMRTRVFTMAPDFGGLRDYPEDSWFGSEVVSWIPRSRLLFNRATPCMQ